MLGTVIGLIPDMTFASLVISVPRRSNARL
jgi:hypothetical protein